MAVTLNPCFLAYFAIGGEYLDVKAALANAIGTISGGVFLTVFYFACAQKVLRPPRLTGTWVLESTVSQTKYNPFRGMVLRYKVLLLQDGARIYGTAEKIYERSDKERTFTGANRSTATLDGTIQKAYLGRSAIILHVTEKGEQRPFSWIVEARCKRFGRHARLVGEFSGTAGDASGTVSLDRIHHPNLLNEYCGLPLVWFSHLVEAITLPFYSKEWDELKRKVNKLAAVTEEFWRTHNCHLLIAALILAEDRRFYSHGGADPIAICRALLRTLGGKLQGGSTIEQQLVRRLTSDHRKSLRRKLKEVALAVRLHQSVRKDLIPLAYIVAAYYGWHMNGVRQAARRLSIELKDPGAEEAAKLIARIRHPEPHRPGSRQEARVAKREAWITSELRARAHLLY